MQQRGWFVSSHFSAPRGPAVDHKGCYCLLRTWWLQALSIQCKPVPVLLAELRKSDQAGWWDIFGW